jgi:branched-chain amino acid transport system substrate-binding protein
VAPTDRMAAEKIFEHMKKSGISKVALLAETSGFGQSGAREVNAVAPKYGITLVGSETYGAKDTDMTAQLAKIKALPGLQAVLVFGAGQGPAVATRNYRQLAISQPLYQSHGVASDEYLRLTGPAAEGVRLPASALVVASQLVANDSQKAVLIDFEKSYRDQYKTEVSSFGGHGYDALMIGLAAIRKAGSTDKAKVRDAIEATRGHVGTAGKFTLTASDHMGLDQAAFRMLEVKNGDWKLMQ